MDFTENDVGSSDRPFRLKQRAWPMFAGRWRSSRGLRRLGLALITLVFTLCFFAACAAGLLFLRLSRGPIAVNLESQVSKALALRVRHGFRFKIGGTDVQTSEGRPTLVVHQLLVQDEAGTPVIRAPEATVSVDPLQMLSGTIVPTRLDVHDVTLKLVILPDGDVAFSAGTDNSLPFRLSEAFEHAAPSPAAVRPRSDENPTGSISAKASAPDPDAFDRLAKVLTPLLDRFTGADDALGGFDRLGVTRGMLVLDDRAHNSVSTFKNLDFDFERGEDGAARMSLSAEGAAGRWSASVSGSRQSNGRRALGVELHNVTLDELRSVPGLREPGFDTDLPLSGRLDMMFNPSGSLSGLDVQADLGPGVFKLDDPDHEPLFVTSIETAFHFDPGTRTVSVSPSTILTETGDYRFAGRISPSPTGEDWTVVASGKGIVGPERPNETPIALERIDAALRLDPGEHRLDIDKLEIGGAQVSLGLSGSVLKGADGLRIALKAHAGRMPAAVILRLWPTTVSAAVRSWLLVNLQAGTVEHGTAVSNLDEADLAKMKVGRSVADDHLRVDYTVSGLTLGFMKGLPPLKSLAANGVVTGDTSKLAVSHAVLDVSPGRELTLVDGSLVVPSTDPKPTPAVITAHVSGGVDVLADLLSSDALKDYAGPPPEAASAKGQIDGTLSVALDLGARARSNDPKVTANARITGLAIEKVFGKQNLTDGNVTMALDATGLRAKGDAMLAGAPSTIDIKKPAGTAPGEANLVMTFDEAARLKAGLSMGKAVAGPIVAKITTVIGASDHKANVDLDLTRATLANPVPGLAKAAGKPGRVTLVATQRETGVDLDNIVCDIGSFSVRGSADLDANGSFRDAKLTQVRLSPGDDLKVDATQVGDTLKLTVRATNVDARPFLKSLSDTDPGDTGGRDLDLDLHANVLTGQNSQAMTGVDLKMGRRGGQIRKLVATGKIGRAPIALLSSPQGNVLTINASSGDAGATLEFMDLYKRIAGGQLDTTIHMMNGRWDGSAVVHEFGLREDPAMKRLADESISQSTKSGNDLHIDSSNLNFTKLFIDFSKNGSKVDVKDGAIFSPQMGATVQGSIDFGHDKLALSGTFVPIYGVNNLFAQVPLVGPILGGGAHEGLFGLNYKISGSVAKPDLTIDPLSALAPGFLRKIFGAISEAAEGSAPAPQSGKPDIDPAAR